MEENKARRVLQGYIYPSAVSRIREYHFQRGEEGRYGV
jgi:hypothetical protein